MSVRRLCEEEATEEKAEAAGAELKTKTPHSDVGNNQNRTPGNPENVFPAAARSV